MQPLIQNTSCSHVSYSTLVQQKLVASRARLHRGEAGLAGPASVEPHPAAREVAQGEHAARALRGKSEIGVRSINNMKSVRIVNII